MWFTITFNVLILKKINAKKDNFADILIILCSFKVLINLKSFVSSFIVRQTENKNSHSTFKSWIKENIYFSWHLPLHDVNILKKDSWCNFWKPILPENAFVPPFCKSRLLKGLAMSIKFVLLNISFWYIIN